MRTHFQRINCCSGATIRELLGAGAQHEAVQVGRTEREHDLVRQRRLGPPERGLRAGAVCGRGRRALFDARRRARSLAQPRHPGARRCHKGACSQPTNRNRHRS